MTKRLFFPLVTLFWVIMNVLLWRSQMSAGRNGGTPVPTQFVWQRILTAPDESVLEIRQDRLKIGRCRWVTDITQAEPADGSEASEIEGQVQHVTGYTLDFEGTLILSQAPRAVRFHLNLAFDRHRVWKNLHLMVAHRPNDLAIDADNAAGTVAFRFDRAGHELWSRHCTFAELAQPERILSLFGGPLAFASLAPLLDRTGMTTATNLDLGIQWDARQDWMKLGSSRVRVYRLRAHLFDKYEANITVSRVGELLRVELPQRVSLVNEAISAFRFAAHKPARPRGPAFSPLQGRSGRNGGGGKSSPRIPKHNVHVPEAAHD